MDPILTDDGCGVRLRRSRINVYDIVGHLEAGDDDATILYWLPITGPELGVFKEYIDAHRDDVMASYREITARRDAEIAAQQAKYGVRDHKETRARLRAYSEFVVEMRKNPVLFPALEGEDPDDRRRRLIAACERWWLAHKAARVGAA